MILKPASLDSQISSWDSFRDTVRADPYDASRIDGWGLDAGQVRSVMTRLECSRCRYSLDVYVYRCVEVCRISALYP